MQLDVFSSSPLWIMKIVLVVFAKCVKRTISFSYAVVVFENNI